MDNQSLWVVGVGPPLDEEPGPAESKIPVNAWWLANNPAHWKIKPEEFRPERFLEEESMVEPNGYDFRHLPIPIWCRPEELPRHHPCYSHPGNHNRASRSEL
ncbi:Belongs to the cytochrome P450 [Dionaea muscipula]